MNEIFQINDNPNARGFYNDINRTQMQTLEDFKKRIEDQKLVNNVTKYNDRFYLRFLRARKFDLEKSFLMISNYFNWRKEQNVDELIYFSYPEITELKKNYKHGYHNTDKEGRPVYIESYEGIDLEKIFAVTTEERWIKYYIREYEILVNFKFRACSKYYGKIIEQTFNITNLQGVSLSLLTGKIKSIMQKLSSIGQNYYPEILGKVFLINAPGIFKFIWAIVKGFLDPKTVEKMTILNTEYQSILLEHIDKDKLPKILGGECECKEGCLFSNAGPWKL